MAEFYFDVKTMFMKNDLELKDLPLFNVERDYYDSGLKYVLYFVLPQLNARGEGEHRDFSDVPFDAIAIRYDKNGIIMEKLETETISNEGGIDNGGKIEVEFKREDFLLYYARQDRIKDVVNEIGDAEPTSMCMGGFRIDLATSNGFRYRMKTSKEDDLSGLGKIILYRKSEPQKKTIIYFAINFGFKRKILYSIKNDKVIFYGINICDKIPVKILFNKERYPCLRSDQMGVSMSFLVKFNGKSHVTIKSDRWHRYAGYKMHLTFDLGYRPDPTAPDKDVPYSKIDEFYILECIENDTLDMKRLEHKRPPKVQFCPYCHSPLITKYKKGGSHCQMLAVKAPTSDFFIEERKGGPARGAIYCKEDMKKWLMSPTSPFDRILPQDYLNRQNFKLAILGSGRSGKSTYISRLFNIEADKSGGIMMKTKMLENALRIKNGKRGICTISNYVIKQVKREKREKKEKITQSDNAWFMQNETRPFFEKYVCDLVNGKFPRATDPASDKTDSAADPFKYPFILDVNNRHYISIYDIAGEDVENKPDRANKLFDNASIGVFYIINGEFDSAGADRVQRTISSILKDKVASSCPVAVIVSKFDRLEHEFDENCYCLRSDSRDMAENSYEGSRLERCVDLASEEIKAYLGDKGLDPFEGVDNANSLNVKYFSVSSFSAPDSIFHMDDKKGTGEVNYLKYLSSPKRIELPIIWMLKQFGCIT